MVQIICQVKKDKPGQVTFTWSEGPASFDPYHLTGQFFLRFERHAQEARSNLGKLVKVCNLNHSQRATEAEVLRAAYELAESGYKLYRDIFEPSADQLHGAHEVREWLDGLQAQGAVESLEMVTDELMFVPWNVVYDREPQEEVFLPGEDDWTEPFWGVRYNLAGSRRVDPWRRKPIWENPDVLLVVDPAIREGLEKAGRQRLIEFAYSRKLAVVESKAQLVKALKSGRPDVMYWLCHASPKALVLGDEEISPDDLLEMLRGDIFEGGRVLGGLAFLNACQTAEESGDAGSFIDTLFGLGMSGLIATEQLTIDNFANSLGLDFLEGFLEEERPVGELLHTLRKGGLPLGLLYAAYCPPHLRVRNSAGRPIKAGMPATPFDATRAGGKVLGANVAATHAGNIFLGANVVAESVWPLPPTPYRSLTYYDRSHRALFAGRDADVRRFAELLDRSDTRLLLLHGESGVGKTSFLRAGLIPFLEEECIGYKVLRNQARVEDRGEEGEAPLLLVRATNDLTSQLAKALHDTCAEPLKYERLPSREEVSVDLRAVLRRELKRDPQPDAIRSALETDPLMLGRFLAALSDELPYGLVLVIDQGEEVFTLASTPDDIERRKGALESLRRLPDVPGDFKVIFSLRTEYHGRLIDRLRRGYNTSGAIREYLLTDFGREELREAIELPTSKTPIPYASEPPHNKYGFSYDEGAADEIAGRVIEFARSKSDSILPLIQVICTQLYDLAKQRKVEVIKADDLRLIGGVQGGLRRHVEALLAKLLSSTADQEAFKKLLTKLYLRQPNGSLTTALLPKREVAKLWTSRTPFEQVLEKTSQSEFRLLRLSTLGIGDEEEISYVSLGHDSLAKIAAQWDEELSRGAKQRRMFKWMVVLAALTVIMIVASVLMFKWQQKAEKAQKEAESHRSLALARQLAAQGRTAQPDLGLLLAVEAYRRHDTLDIRSALLDTLEKEPRITSVVRAAPEGVRDIAFNQDSSLFAAVESNSIRIFDAATRAPRGRPLASRGRPFIKAAFIAGEDKLASVDEENMVTIWSLETREPEGSPWQPSAPPRHLEDSFVYFDDGRRFLTVFSPDGKTLASTDSNVISIFDTVTGQRRASDARADESVVYCLTVGPSGDLLAWGSTAGTAFLYDLKRGITHRLELSRAEYTSDTFIDLTVNVIDFAADGKTLVVGYSNGSVRRWDVGSRKQLGNPINSDNSPSSIALSADGSYAALGSSWRGTIELWDLRKGERYGQPLIAHTQRASSLHFSPDGRTLISGGGDALIIFWDIERTTRIGSVIEAPHFVPYAEDTRTFVHYPYVYNSAAVTETAYSADGSLIISATDSGDVQVRNSSNPTQLLSSFKADGAGIVSPDGKLLVSISSISELSLYDMTTGQKLNPPFTFINGLGSQLAFSHGGRILASAHYKGDITLLDVATRQLLGTLPTALPEEGADLGMDIAMRGVSGMRFSADDTALFVVYADGQLVVWDVARREQRVKAALGIPPYHAAFRADGKRVAVGEINMIQLWDVESAKQEGEPLVGHASPKYILAFSGDGKMLASGGEDGTVALWDADTQRRLGPVMRAAVLRGLDISEVRSLAFRPDGRQLASGNENGSLVLWDLDVNSWVERACGVAKRNLTCNEWGRFIGVEPYRQTCPKLPPECSHQ